MGDVELKLGGRAYRLRPTFGAMREIEAETNSSCATLLGLLARQELHVGEMAVIVFHGMAAAGNEPDREACGEALFEAGIGSAKVRDPIASYLTELLYAPDSAKKKDVGEWWRTSEEITSRRFVLPPETSDTRATSSTEPPPENSGPTSKPSVKNPSD